jgi:hypothetical protein
MTTAEIISQSFDIRTKTSKSAPNFGVIISVRDVGYESATLVIGAPGMPNAVKTFDLGDALLFETPSVGLVEIRLTSLKPPEVQVLVTKVSPRMGITAGLEPDGGQNAPFSTDERARIRTDLASVLQAVSRRPDISPEQLELLSRKLDEVAAASERLGRKDWIMFAAGTLTNVAIGAAFEPEVTKTVFTAMNGAFGWVFQNALRLLLT